MPFCPECKYEYEATVWKCPDCGVRLVAALPEEADEYEEPQYENWVQLARLTSSEYTEMVVGALENMEIPVVVHSGAGHFGITGQMSTNARPIGGGYSILVPHEFVAKADLAAEGILGDEWKAARLVDIEIDESDAADSDQAS